MLTIVRLFVASALLVFTANVALAPASDATAPRHGSVSVQVSLPVCGGRRPALAPSVPL